MRPHSPSSKPSIRSRTLDDRCSTSAARGTGVFEIVLAPTVFLGSFVREERGGSACFAVKARDLRPATRR